MLDQDLQYTISNWFWLGYSYHAFEKKKKIIIKNHPTLPASWGVGASSCMQPPPHPQSSTWKHCPATGRHQGLARLGSAPLYPGPTAPVCLVQPFFIQAHLFCWAPPEVPAALAAPALTAMCGMLVVLAHIEARCFSDVQKKMLGPSCLSESQWMLSRLFENALRNFISQEPWLWTAFLPLWTRPLIHKQLSVVCPALINLRTLYSYSNVTEI